MREMPSMVAVRDTLPPLCASTSATEPRSPLALRAKRHRSGPASRRFLGASPSNLRPLLVTRRTNARGICSHHRVRGPRPLRSHSGALADVAWPIVLLEQVQGGTIKFPDLLLLALACDRQE